MTLTSCLYLVEVISNINDIIGILLLISIVGILVPIIVWGMSFILDEHHLRDSIYKVFKLHYKKAWILIILIALNVIIPTKKTMYLMLGTNYLSQSGIPTKVSQALELKLDDIIQELKPKESDDGQGKVGQTEDIEASQV